ncbi:PTS lactose/cellobiose transporter subunit IIA [Lactovum odontotermitis]
MEGLELISFTIISNVGSAKSLIMESMKVAREGRFDEAKKIIEEANKLLTIGEKEHFKVITQEAKEQNVSLNILFMHAEDQLMTTVLLRDMANELIEMNKMFLPLIEKNQKETITK